MTDVLPGVGPGAPVRALAAPLSGRWFAVGEDNGPKIEQVALPEGAGRGAEGCPGGRSVQKNLRRSRREAMASREKTLRRWYSTVLGVTWRRAAISRLVWLARTRSTTSRSRVVRSGWGGLARVAR